MTHFHAKLIHEVDYLVIDFTYKRPHGDWKEFEVVSWDSKNQKRMSELLLVIHTLITTTDKSHTGTAVCRVWSKYETREMFHLLFRAFFLAVKSATGRELKLKVLQPTTGTLHGFAADGAIAQAMGLGDAIVELPRSEDSIFLSNNPEQVPNYVMRTCFVHYTR